ncbi:MAG: phosphatidylinositol mannoside acyltransferase [Actinomycetota bacterium]
MIGLGYLLAWQIARALPERAAYAVADYLSLRSWRRNVRRRDIVTKNLAVVVGQSPDLQSVVRDAFISYGRYWIEAFRLTDLSFEELSRRLVIDGTEHLDSGQQSGGVVLAVPHIGNWDAPGWFVAKKWGLAVVVEVLRPRILFERFVRFRRQLGMTVIPLARGGNATGKCIEAIKNGEVVALVCDRDLSGAGVPVTMFGRTTKLPPGPAVIALRSGAAIVPAAALQAGKGRWHTKILPPIYAGPGPETPEKIAEIMQLVATAFEAIFREKPEQWHAWSPYWTD